MAASLAAQAFRLAKGQIVLGPYRIQRSVDLIPYIIFVMCIYIYIYNADTICGRAVHEDN